MSVKLFGTWKKPRAEPITTDLDGWTPVEGEPTMKTWIENKTDDGKFLTGFWEATPGTYRVVYKADELIHFFEGRLALTPDGGETRIFQAGDSFHISEGFTGTWKTEVKIRKIFAIRIK